MPPFFLGLIKDDGGKLKSCWRCDAPPNNIYPDGNDLKCFKCGYLQDREKVAKILLEKMKQRTDWQTYGANKEYLYRKKMKLPKVGKKGRKNKWG